jgi:hypothetical protein
MAKAKKQSGDKESRLARIDSLRKRIERMRSDANISKSDDAAMKPLPGESPRTFVERRMLEIGKNKRNERA